MNLIRKIKQESLWIFILPMVSVNLCLFIVIYFAPHLKSGDGLPFMFPYFDGGASISRTARVFPTYFIFKPAMIVTGIFLIKYWSNTYELLQTVNKTKIKKYFKYFGIISAVCLILHAIFLGIKFDIALYKIFRRVIMTCFILFELIAQTILVINLVKLRNQIKDLISKKILVLKLVLVTLLILVTIFSFPILTSSGNTQLKHALEWNFFVGVLAFYLLTHFFWIKKK